MFSPQAKAEAKKLTLPDTGEDVIHFTEYDTKVWQAAFDWYNKTMKPEHEFTLKCRHCYHKVYLSLKQAQSEA